MEEQRSPKTTGRLICMAETNKSVLKSEKAENAGSKEESQGGMVSQRFWKIAFEEGGNKR